MISGRCQVTGISDPSVPKYAESILNLTIISSSGSALQIKRRKLSWGKDNHGHQYDAFRGFFYVSAKEAATIDYIQPANCQGPNSTERDLENSRNIQVPVDFRMKSFNGKVVLMVTQYYSKIKLSWLTIFLNYYLSVGVDFVALYTGFQTQREKFQKYNRRLTELISQPRFKNHVIRFEFSDMSAMDSWSRAQAGMINHGMTVFFWINCN